MIKLSVCMYLYHVTTLLTHHRCRKPILFDLKFRRWYLIDQIELRGRRIIVKKKNGFDLP